MVSNNCSICIGLGSLCLGRKLAGYCGDPRSAVSSFGTVTRNQPLYIALGLQALGGTQKVRLVSSGTSYLPTGFAEWGADTFQAPPQAPTLGV